MSACFKILCYTSRAGEERSSNDNKNGANNAYRTGYGVPEQRQSDNPKVLEKTHTSETIDLTEVGDEDLDLVEVDRCATTKWKDGENDTTIVIKYPIEWTFQDNVVLLTNEDVQRLQPNYWISGALVDFYSLWQQRRLATNNVHGVLVVDNFVWTKIKCTWDGITANETARGGARGGPTEGISDAHMTTDGLQRLRKRLNFFGRRHTIMPIVFNNHWSVLMISHVDEVMTSPDQRANVSPCIMHFNSMREYHTEVDVCIRRFLLDEYISRQTVGVPTTLSVEEEGLATARFCGGENFPTLRPNLLRQSNTDDCGIFACQYIQLLCDRMLQGEEACFNLPKCFTRSWFPQSAIEKKRMEIPRTY
jgi:Ulp1 family protease